MRLPSPAMALVAIMILGSFPATARAGTFMRYESTDTVSVQPLRIRIHFAVAPTHLWGITFCGLLMQPGSYQGSTPRPILSCEAPPGITCTTDSLGGARFTADPCRPPGPSGGSADSLAIVIDGLPEWVDCAYLTTGGVIADGDWLWVTPDLATPAARRSLGRLKSRFR